MSELFENHGKLPDQLVLTIFTRDGDERNLLSERLQEMAEEFFDRNNIKNKVCQMNILSASYPDVKQVIAMSHIVILCDIKNLSQVSDLVSKRTVQNDIFGKKFLTVTKGLEKNYVKSLLSEGVNFCLNSNITDEDFESVLELLIKSIVLQAQMIANGEQVFA